MPAMLEDPTAPAIYRTSGVTPYPTPLSSDIPPTITPRQVTLRDRITIASLLPFSTPSTIPPRLLSYLRQQLNREIERGDTYPMIEPMPESTFATYWFQNFGAIMILGEIGGEGYVEEVWRMEEEGVKWEECALGSFYVKPNYPGRSSHVCNGGFLVTEAARNKGVGRLMGEGYLEWAPRLGYTYSVFNLVYETNTPSCRIWDALGFKRIGRVKACGNLRSYPGALVDAIIYGRDLGPEGEDYVSEERFDKIRFYLKHGKYPNGADRAEKSRLRSAATHYKLLPAEEGSGREGDEDAERLMLRDKEVVSDPQRQYEIGRTVHVQGQHGGINKTTATIAEKFHWVRIKETVSLVIKNCPDCKDSTAKLPPTTRSQASNGSDGNGGASATPAGNTPTTISTLPPNPVAEQKANTEAISMIEHLMDFTSEPTTNTPSRPSHPQPQGQPPSATDFSSSRSGARAPTAHMTPHLSGALSSYADIPLDPQIMAVQSQSRSQSQQAAAYGTRSQAQQQQRPHPWQQQQQQIQTQNHGNNTPHVQYANPQTHPTLTGGSGGYPQPPTQIQTQLAENSNTTTSSSNDALRYGGAGDQGMNINPMSMGMNMGMGGGGSGMGGGGVGRLAPYDSRSSVDVDAEADADAEGDADATFDVEMDGVDGEQEGPAQAGRDDTRLATERHIRRGDEPGRSR